MDSRVNPVNTVKLETWVNRGSGKCEATPVFLTVEASANAARGLASRIA